MGITTSNKELSRTQINFDDSFQIRLSLSAEPDIVLTLWQYVGQCTSNLKSDTKTFIDVIDEAVDNTQDGQIGDSSLVEH